MGQQPAAVPFAIVAWDFGDDHIHTMPVPETAIPVAVKQGWTVVATDTEIAITDIAGPLDDYMTWLPMRSGTRRNKRRAEENDCNEPDED